MQDRIRSMWEEYRKEVLPANAGLVQRRECRAAFFAGFTAALATAAQLGHMPAGEDMLRGGLIAAEDKDVCELWRELERFRDSVQAGDHGD